jgi:hypothetical protein
MASAACVWACALPEWETGAAALDGLLEEAAQTRRTGLCSDLTDRKGDAAWRRPSRG